MTELSDSYQIYFHYYELVSRTQPNSATQNLVRQGALLKIEDQDGAVGYSDICPWPHLGDLALDQQIKIKGPLYQRAMQLAVRDLQARQNHVMLVGPEPLVNNILVTNYKELSKLLETQSLANHILKIKGDRNIQELAEVLNRCAKDCKKIRLDFNFCLSELEFSYFLNLLEPTALNKINYIEDPFAFDSQAWKKYSNQVKLALDWGKPSEKWSYMIQKPSRQEVDELVSSTLTSAMEHPVGFAHGLYYAQKYPSNIHGFSTLNQFQDTPVLAEFNKDFHDDKGNLVYTSDGYGIGFTKQLAKINWVPAAAQVISSDFSNQLLINPRLNKDEKKYYHDIKKYFSLNVQSKNYYLIPSSGSSDGQNKLTKVIALTQDALINSALRVNKYFNITHKSVLGSVLPQYHVGGLMMTMRAAVAQATIKYCEWIDFTADWIIDNRITHLSLVPTQVFDIVQKNISAPDFIEYVFVGGSELLPSLKDKMLLLGWPLIETFGMTETGSMVAYKKDNFFELLPDVHINSNNGFLEIKCDSLCSHIIYFDMNKKSFDIKAVNQSFLTSDMVDVFDHNKFKFNQRSGDYIKINGEGVSLPEIRSKLLDLSLAYGLGLNDITISHFPDDRSGQKLIFITSQLQSYSKIQDIFLAYNKSVRPYEKISEWLDLDYMPLTDLNKIKFNIIQEMIKEKSIYVKKV